MPFVLVILCRKAESVQYITHLHKLHIYLWFVSLTSSPVIECGSVCIQMDGFRN